MKIDAVYIACYRYDIRLTRILFASIRYWYPDLPIVLVKDELFGRYDTSEIETAWNVSIFPAERPVYGWGFGKLEPLFQPGGKRCLILDSDIVFAGPVLELLEPHDEDFIVTHEVPPDEKFIEDLYFQPAKVERLDPEFKFPGYTFNSGQIVATTGVLSRADFEPFVNWTHPPTLKQPEVFKLGEQGLINYMVTKRHAQGRLSLRRIRFMEVASGVVRPSIEDLARRQPHPFVIHWCGLRGPRFDQRTRADILAFFERYYYGRVRFGAMKRVVRPLLDDFEKNARQWMRSLRERLRMARQVGAL
jgi:hypothetical protein